MFRNRRSLVAFLCVATLALICSAADSRADEIQDFSNRLLISGNNRRPRILYENWDAVDFHRIHYRGERFRQFLLDDVSKRPVPTQFFQLKVDLSKCPTIDNNGAPFPPTRWRVPEQPVPISPVDPNQYKLLNP